MDLAGTKKQMGGFEFPDAATMKSKYMNKGGILMTYLDVWVRCSLRLKTQLLKITLK